MTSKRDARNITTTYTYDNANRPTGKTYLDSTPATSWGYDANGYTGLQTAMTDGLGTVTKAYDNMNRLTQEALPRRGLIQQHTVRGFIYLEHVPQ